MKSLLALLLTLVSILSAAHEAVGAQVAVRFPEGMVRGFLVLHDGAGARIASGDFMQLPEEGGIRCRTIFYFKDGSYHEESALFTQKGNFELQSYRLIQKGPSFEKGMEVSLDREKGTYRVKVKGKEEKVLEGKLDFPADLYNGMVPTVLKNMKKGARNTVHFVAFTPTPRVVELEMVPSGDEKVLVGDRERNATHYVVKPRLGILKVPAMLTGRTPPDNHIWTIMEDVPAFVRFTGPLANGGPVWRVELTSPRWPK